MLTYIAHIVPVAQALLGRTPSLVLASLTFHVSDECPQWTFSLDVISMLSDS